MTQTALVLFFKGTLLISNTIFPKADLLIRIASNDSFAFGDLFFVSQKYEKISAFVS